MQLETIVAPNYAEAIKRVKTLFGNDAVIVHSRTVEKRRWLGLRKSTHVEVTAGKGAAVPRVVRGAALQDAVRRQIGQSGQISRPVEGSSTALPAVTGGGQNRIAEAYGYSRALSATSPRESSPSVNPPINPPLTQAAAGRALLESPAGTNATMLNMASELGGLRGMVDQLVKEVRTRSAPNVPADLFEHYLKLIESDVAEELATDIIRAVQRSLKPEQFHNVQLVQDKLVEQIEKLIPTAGKIERKKAVGPHVVALIGPTGVGKTTTIAKLAAHLKLRERRKVGLITIDTYRIAAIDQLKRYADLMGVVVQVVASPDEIAQAIASMSDCEFVLIDTAGRSPSDSLKLGELRRFLELAKPDEVHLVLSTTCGTRSAELVMQKFAELRYDRVIFTKIDEAAHLGVVLNVVQKVNKHLSYITTGQDVPDDIEVGVGRNLARMIVGQDQK